MTAFEARACTESKMSRFFPRKFPCPLIFYIPLPLLPASFAFLSPFLFSFVGHLLGFLLVGKGFAKNSRIVNIFGRKYEWVAGQEFF